MDWDSYRAFAASPFWQTRFLLSESAAVARIDGATVAAETLEAQLGSEPLRKPVEHRGGSETDLFPVALPVAQATALAELLARHAAAGTATPGTADRADAGGGTASAPLAGFAAVWREYADASAAARSVCVFCGYAAGVDAEFAADARAIGTALALAGHTLVYGGGKGGLMGAVSQGALDAFGRVEGVIPGFLVQREQGRHDIAERLEVRTLSERKDAMIDRSQLFLALPGGWGTLDEIMEVLTWRQLGQTDAPLLLFSPNGFYDPLLAQFEQQVAAGFLERSALAGLQVLTEREQILDAVRRSGTP
jgi:uncharacterized protein (TIGR00730 family)